MVTDRLTPDFMRYHDMIHVCAVSTNDFSCGRLRNHYSSMILQFDNRCFKKWYFSK